MENDRKEGVSGKQKHTVLGCITDGSGKNRLAVKRNDGRRKTGIPRQLFPGSAAPLEGEGNAFLYIENKQNGVSLDFNYDSNKGATTIIDRVDGKKVEKRLVDALPELEI